MESGLDALLGLGRDGDVGPIAMVLRTIVVYVATVGVVRVSGSRFLSRATPFDFIVSISVVPYRRKPRVVDVAVEDGVQSVRIDLG